MKKKTVDEIAKAIGVSRRTLLRKFKTHLQCSVKDYISVVQFRKTLHRYQYSIQKPSFTDLTYSNDYYDQSELIRHFRQKTGENPKRFFKTVKKIGAEDTFWKFH